MQKQKTPKCPECKGEMTPLFRKFGTKYSEAKQAFECVKCEIVAKISGKKINKLV